MAMLQSAMFALLLEHDPEAWYLHSMVEFGCCLYAVSSEFFMTIITHHVVYILISIKIAQSDIFMDRELDLQLPFLFKPGAYHKEVPSFLQCSILYAQSSQPFYLLCFYMKSYILEGNISLFSVAL